MSSPDPLPDNAWSSQTDARALRRELKSPHLSSEAWPSETTPSTGFGNHLQDPFAVVIECERSG